MDYKQVIVIRRKYLGPDGQQRGLRRGKEISQGCHASMKVILDLGTVKYFTDDSQPGPQPYLCIPLTNNLRPWIQGLFTKIVVGVDSEQELLDLYQKAQDAKILSCLIQDAGLTEFKEPTFTAIAIGPDSAEKIDPITSHLKLL